MDFEQKLLTYAKLIVTHGLNVQPGQLVNISTEAVHRSFALLIAKEAYAVGAKYVNLELTDPRSLRVRVQESVQDNLEFVPKYLTTKFDELLDERAANLKLIGSEFPDVLEDLDAKAINTVRMASYKAVKNFYDEGIGKSKVHWTVAAASTPAWGQKVFKELHAEAACEALWDDIFSICRADKEDCLLRWKQHNAVLQGRAKKFTDMKIKELHFTGPGTDLTVGLSEKAVFKGGSEEGPYGEVFEPNLPTEEVFTTPDWRKTNGTARATRPFFINGKLIRGLEMTFENGVLKSFSAESGEDTFREYTSSDDGAARLGEVALVGIDSPVYQTSRVYQEILFDENAACHIAVGSAYKFCLDGGADMKKDELIAVGCNESSVHTDMMISSEEVDVTAKLYNGKEVKLISKGAWA